MKKRMMYTALFTTLFLTVTGVQAVELGIPFGFGGNTIFGSQDRWDWGHDIGLRIHISDGFAIQPALSLSMVDDATNIGINVDALFYLFESNGIRQYLGGNLGVNVTDGDDNLRLGGIYGLQHSISPAVDIFGQIGLGIRFDPNRVYTVNTQLGVIFYIVR